MNGKERVSSKNLFFPFLQLHVISTPGQFLSRHEAEASDELTLEDDCKITVEDGFATFQVRHFTTFGKQIVLYGVVPVMLMVLLAGDSVSNENLSMFLSINFFNGNTVLQRDMWRQTQNNTQGM